MTLLGLGAFDVGPAVLRIDGVDRPLALALDVAGTLGPREYRGGREE